MPYYVYILHSSKLNRFYIGTTDNVDKRVEEHNTSKYMDAFTTKGIPWNLYLCIVCNSSEQAYQIERFIKNMKSSDFIKRLKENSKISDDLLKRFR